MAADTDKRLRNQVMYQIFVRNFSEEGTFEAVRPKLDHIRSLGVDIIWLMPIHPIGEAKRKGSLGSPYAIKDYRAVNPEFGTVDDLKTLVDDIHAHGMKCIIDVVYNHTSPDSVLAKKHPEWFYHKEDGSFGNRVGDWSDIIDLDYSHRELWNYQIETLKFWAGIVDGFRCDVASLVPVEFWKEARCAVETVRPGCIWLSESVHPEFIIHMRQLGYSAFSDSEVYQAFDITYDYDCYEEFAAYLNGSGTLKEYLGTVNRQEFIYPDNYIKLRFLENHDMPRARFLIPDPDALRNWTAFMFFQKGLPLIYNGQEYGFRHLPDLFNKDTVDWNSGEMVDLSDLIRRLADIRRDPLFADSSYKVTPENDDFIVAQHSSLTEKAVGVFSLTGRASVVKVPLKDGSYINKLDDSSVDVMHGMISSDGQPVIIMSDETA